MQPRPTEGSSQGFEFQCGEGRGCSGVVLSVGLSVRAPEDAGRACFLRLEKGGGVPRPTRLHCPRSTKSPCLAFGGLCRPRSLAAPPPALSARGSGGQSWRGLSGPPPPETCVGHGPFRPGAAAQRPGKEAEQRAFSAASEKPQISTGALRWRGGAGGQTSDPFPAQPAFQVWGLRRASERHSQLPPSFSKSL